MELFKAALLALNSFQHIGKDFFSQSELHLYADDTIAFTIGDSTDERKTFCLTKFVAGVNQKGDDPASPTLIK